MAVPKQAVMSLWSITIIVTVIISWFIHFIPLKKSAVRGTVYTGERTCGSQKNNIPASYGTGRL